MTREYFYQALAVQQSPEKFSELQTALWHAAKGNWDAAHHIAQAHEGEQRFDRLHAYLHRVEGDAWNADYWYRRSGERRPDISLHEELKGLIERWV